MRSCRRISSCHLDFNQPNMPFRFFKPSSPISSFLNTPTCSVDLLDFLSVLKYGNVSPVYISLVEDMMMMKNESQNQRFKKVWMKPKDFFLIFLDRHKILDVHSVRFFGKIF